MIRRKVLLAIAIIAVLLTVTIPVLASTNQVLMPGSGWDPLGGRDSVAVWSRLGQRVTIPDREIVILGFRVCKVGNATGDVVYSIRDSLTDEVIVSQVWGDASELPEQGTNGYRTLNFTTPVRVNGDVRLCVEYWGGTNTSHCEVGYFAGDRITGEFYTNYMNYCTDIDGWHDIGEAEECCYTYFYLVEDKPEPGNGDTPDNGSSGGGIPTPLWIVIIAAPITGGLSVWYYMSKRHTKT